MSTIGLCGLALSASLYLAMAVVQSLKRMALSASISKGSILAHCGFPSCSPSGPQSAPRRTIETIMDERFGQHALDEIDRLGDLLLR